MQVSIIRQTPVASVLMMLLLVVATFTRFAIAPYGDELIAGGAAQPCVWVDNFQYSHPVWGVIFSALVVVLTSMIAGRTTSALGLYPARTTITIPLYVIIACGIFIAPNSLSVSLSALCVMQMLRYLCGEYMRGTDLTFAFYVGLCAGVAPLLYAPAITFIALLPIAILIFGFSWREVVVMVTGLILPLSALCYVGWLCGGAFTAPVLELFKAVGEPSGYTPWDSESVVALTLIGVILFMVLCGILAFAGEKRAVAMRPRTIITLLIIAQVVALATFALPSATAGLFMLVAPVAAILIPFALLRLRDELSNLAIITLLLLLTLHLFIA